MLITAPSQDAVRQGIDRRWEELSGATKELPFSFEHARAALHRIIAKLPPCGSNNEQFRDSCIWQAVLDLASEAAVHLVTNDNAFYESGRSESGMSTVLAAEAKSAEHTIRLHRKLSDFLNEAGLREETPDTENIKIAIEPHLIEAARDIVTNQTKEPGFRLGPLSVVKIEGYATPKMSFVAVHFSAKFELEAETPGSIVEPQSAVMTLSGSCTHDPNSGSVADLQISDWQISSKRGGWTSISASPRLANATLGDIEILR